MRHFKCKLFRSGLGDRKCKKFKRECIQGFHIYEPCGRCGPNEESDGPKYGPDKEHPGRNCKRGRGHHGPYHGLGHGMNRRHGPHHGGHGHGPHHGGHGHGPHHGGHGHGPPHKGHGPFHCGHGPRHGHGPHRGGHGPHHGHSPQREGHDPHHRHGPHHGGPFFGPHGRGPRDCHGAVEHDDLRRRMKDWSKEELLLALINTIERDSPRVTEITEKEAQPEVAKEPTEEASNEKNAEKEKTTETAEASDCECMQSE